VGKNGKNSKKTWISKFILLEFTSDCLRLLTIYYKFYFFKLPHKYPKSQMDLIILKEYITKEINFQMLLKLQN